MKKEITVNHIYKHEDIKERRKAVQEIVRREFLRRDGENSYQADKPDKPDKPAEPLSELNWMARGDGR